MFKIGEFSKICRVPTSVLRYYDEIDLFKPKHVDTFTGYRYYGLEQLPQLNRILVLRDLELSLAEINKIIKAEISVEEIRGMLRLKQAQLAEHQAEVQAKLNRITHRIRQMENENRMPEYEVVVKKTEAMKIASIREVVVTHAQMPERCGAMFASIGTWLASQHITPSGPAIAIYHDAEYIEANIDVENGLVIPPQAENGDFPAGRQTIRIYDLPADELVASITLKKEGDLLDAWQGLARWIADNQYEIIGPPSREFYIGPPGGDQFAEIQYLIRSVS